MNLGYFSQSTSLIHAHYLSLRLLFTAPYAFGSTLSQPGPIPSPCRGLTKILWDQYSLRALFLILAVIGCNPPATESDRTYGSSAVGEGKEVAEKSESASAISSQENDTDQTTIPPQAIPPQEVAGTFLAAIGSYLVCHQVSISPAANNALPVLGNFGCSVVSSESINPLYLSRKSEPESQKIVDDYFRFSVNSDALPPSTSVTIKNAGPASTVDVFIEVQAPSTTAVVEAVNKVNLFVTILNQDQQPELQIAAHFGSVLDGAKEVAKEIADTPPVVPKKLPFYVPGAVLPDGSVAVVESIQNTPVQSSTTMVHSIVSSIDPQLGELSWAIGQYTDPGTNNGTPQATFLRFDAAGNVVDQEQFGGNLGSAVFSGKADKAGNVYMVGRRIVNGEAFFGGLVARFDSSGQALPPGDFALGQSISNEELFGLDVNEAGVMAVVGRTDRETGQDGMAAYVAIIPREIVNGSQPWHRWMSGNGDQTFNDVIFISPAGSGERRLLAVGQNKRRNCNHTEAMVMEIDSMAQDNNDGIIQYSIFGSRGNDYFQQIIALEGGGYKLIGKMELGADRELNPHITQSEYSDVVVYLNKDKKVDYATLTDGTPINIRDYSDNRDCGPAGI